METIPQVCAAIIRTVTTAAELALALTTAIAKWLKDARVFPDFALIDTYTVQPVDTPDTTPSITVSDANGLCTISIIRRYHSQHSQPVRQRPLHGSR